MTIQELEAKIKEFSLELEKLKKEEEETKQTKPWKSEYGNAYWYVSPIGKSLTYTNIDTDFNTRSYDFGNYYRTEELAKQDAKEQRLRNRVRQLRDTLCEGYKFNRANCNYCIYYSARYKEFVFYERYTFCIGEVYFDNIEHAKQACDALNSEFDEEYMEDFFNGNQD